MAKAKKAEEPVDPRVLAAPTPVKPTAHDRRADDQAIIGHFVEVTEGKYKGRYGVALEAATVDKNGEPTDVVVRTRDNDAIHITVPYKNLLPATSGRR